MLQTAARIEEVDERGDLPPVHVDPVILAAVALSPSASAVDHLHAVDHEEQHHVPDRRQEDAESAGPRSGRSRSGRMRRDPSTFCTAATR